MKKQIYGVGIAVALACAAAVVPARAQVRTWTITMVSGERIDDADLRALRGDTLFVARLGAARALPLDSIAMVYRDEGTQWVAGTLVGAGIGLMGGLCGAVLYVANNNQGDGVNPVLFIVPVAGLTLGGAFGAALGSSARNETRYQIASMSSDEQRAQLESLIAREHPGSIGAAATARNNIYLEVLGNAVFYSLNYESMLTPNIAARAGVEYLSQGFVFPVTVSYLAFNGPGHLELGGGITYASFDAPSITPTLSAGYRYQPLLRGLLFRAGLSLFVGSRPPGGIFEESTLFAMSLGYSF